MSVRIHAFIHSSESDTRSIETEYRNTEKQRERETKISVLFSTVIMIDRSSRSQPGSRTDLLYCMTEGKTLKSKANIDNY